MSEFRQDLISGDWTIIAPGRGARPQMLEVKRPARKASPRNGCPFEDPVKANGEPLIYAFPDGKHWKIMVIQNKYPALTPMDVCAVSFRNGLYQAKTGAGRHDLVITRDHNKNFPAIQKKLATKVFMVLQKLCRDAAQDPCINYAVPFFNWGLLAGASIWHPHYQFLATPIVPAHAAHSVHGAKQYFKKHRRCVRCDLIAFEHKEGKRIIEESKHAIAIAPYASKYPFEVRIMPKAHEPYFHKASQAVVGDTASLLQSVLRRMKKYVNDPDLNVFIHEAPLDGKPYGYHHWHIEIIPRLTTPAGFEFSTGININSVEPEKAANILKNKK